MDPLVHAWDGIAADNPVALLSRKRITAERIMVARVELEPGCEVAMHTHEMEQVGCVQVRSRVRTKSRSAAGGM